MAIFIFFHLKNIVGNFNFPQYSTFFRAKLIYLTCLKFSNHYNLPYSDKEINELKNELLNSSKEFKTRELPEKVCCIYIDAYHCDIKDVTDNKIKQGVIYTVLGIDLND